MSRILSGVRLCVLFLILCLAALVGCQLVFGDVDIGDPPEEPLAPAECDAGDFRCYQENLLACGEGDVGWVTSAMCVTAAFCDDRQKRCRICKSGDRRCSGAVRQECNADGSAWSDVETCSAAALCSPISCGPCTPGDVQCTGTTEDTAEVLQQCNERREWEDVEPCASGQVCSDTVKHLKADPTAPRVCLAPACDAPDLFKCDGLRLLRCPKEQERWNPVDTCQTNELCEESAVLANLQVSMGELPLEKCLDGCASPGSYLCEGMTLLQCSDDRTTWIDRGTCEAGTECNPVAGQCTQPCTPGEYQCNGSTLRRCLTDQTWETIATCASAALCTPAENGCQPPVCPAAGAYQCSGAVLERCSDDLKEWVPQNTCDSAELCNAQSKRCNPFVCPVAGETRCFGQELRQCNAGLTRWEFPFGRAEPLICSAGQFCDPGPIDPGCKTECPTATGCNGADHQTCSPEGWKTDATCKTAALCQCTLTDPDGAGPRTNGCAAGLDADGKCGKEVCRVAGDYREFLCLGNKLQRCQASQNGWEDVATCQSADLCYAGDFQQRIGGYCAVCTRPYEIQCDGNTPGSTLLQCTGDRTRWTTIQTCTGFPCVENTYADYCATCNLGDAQCSGRNLLRCASDRRSFTTEECPSAALCDEANKQCDKCTPGRVTCVGKELRKCSADGQTLTTQMCANVCDDEAGQCDACAAGSAWCAGGVLYQCSADGQMQTGQTCATDALCDAANRVCKAPVCAVGQRQCTTTGQPQVCNAGRTGFINDGLACATPQLCMAGTCTAPACAVGQRRCDMAQPQICNPGRTGFIDTGTACATAQLCTNGVCAEPACAVGQRRCDMAQPQICNPGRTGFVDDGMACTATQVCTNGACAAIVCDAMEKRCNLMQPQICNATRTGWTDSGMACVAPQECMGGACITPVCTAGDIRCGGTGMTVLQKCISDGTGWTDQPCTGTTPVCNAMPPGRCDECVVDSMPECAPGAAAAVRRCNAAGKIVETPCATTEVCMLGECVTAPATPPNP